MAAFRLDPPHRSHIPGTCANTLPESHGTCEVPKNYRGLAGEPVIRPALAAFLSHPQIAAVQPVIHPQDEDVFRSATVGLKKLLPPVWGGATRQGAVRAGPEAFAASAPGIVLIHDAARPFLT